MCETDSEYPNQKANAEVRCIFGPPNSTHPLIRSRGLSREQPERALQVYHTAQPPSNRGWLRPRLRAYWTFNFQNEYAVWWHCCALRRRTCLSGPPVFVASSLWPSLRSLLKGLTSNWQRKSSSWVFGLTSTSQLQQFVPSGYLVAEWGHASPSVLCSGRLCSLHLPAGNFVPA